MYECINYVHAFACILYIETKLVSGKKYSQTYTLFMTFAFYDLRSLLLFVIYDFTWWS